MKQFIYVLLMVILSPIFLLGFSFFMVPILFSRGKVSGTTYEPFNGRLLFHLMGSRPDSATLQLSGGLPATNHVVMTLIIRPIVWVSRITGYTPAFIEYPPPRPTPKSAFVGARCEFLDKAMLYHVSAGDQVVILGAGSAIAFDFFSSEFLEDTLAGKMVRWSVKAIYGKPFTFVFPFTPDFAGRLSNYLEKYQLVLDQNRPLGNEGKFPYYGLVLAVNSTCRS